MKIVFALIWLEDWIDTCVLTYSGMSDSLRLHGLYPPNVLVRRLCSWNFSSKNTGVVCHFLLQGNFLTQGSNPCLLLWQADLLLLHHLGNTERLLLLGLLREGCALLFVVHICLHIIFVFPKIFTYL